MTVWIVQGTNGYIYGLYLHYEDAKQLKLDKDVKQEWHIYSRPILETYGGE